jgi:hypothetical protein
MRVPGTLAWRQRAGVPALFNSRIVATASSGATGLNLGVTIGPSAC